MSKKPDPKKSAKKAAPAPKAKAKPAAKPAPKVGAKPAAKAPAPAANWRRSSTPCAVGMSACWR